VRIVGRGVAVALVACVAAGAVGGCGAVDGVLERFADEGPTGPPTVTIGLALPFGGADLAAARGVEASVRASLADHAALVDGWDVDVVVVDTAQPDVTALAALDAMVDEPSLVAAITGLTTDDVRTMVPELEDDGVASVSPADTDPRHTNGALVRNQLRPWQGYWTVAVQQEPETAAVADYLAEVEAVRRVLVVDDGTPEAAAGVAAAEAAFEVRSVDVERRTVVVPRTWERDVLAALSGMDSATGDPGRGKLRPVDAVHVVGEVALVDAVVAASRASGSPVPVSVGTPLDAEAAAATETGLEGVLVPAVGPDPGIGLDELAARLAQEAAPPPGLYGPAAYDAARLVLLALDRCLPEPTPTASLSRSACRATIGADPFVGLSGEVVVDEFGARVGTLGAVGEVRDGEWVALRG
jgi:hypothetical protein